MNRTEIEAKWSRLSARERDAWVAEVIFNDTIKYNGDVPYGVVRGDYTYGVDRYSTDISAAWAVVEQFTVEVLVRRLGYGFYRCWIAQRSDSVDAGYHATKRTAPEAICLAALIAKLTEVS